MDDDPVVLAMGLLLTEVRSTRRALEGIERSVGRAMPISMLATAGTGAAAFGAPPLFEGALKVYVVNIADLVAEGGGLLGVLGGVLGGVGRFLGGFIGSAVGGTVAGVSLPFVISDIAKIATAADSIMKALTVPGQEEVETETLAQKLIAFRDLLRDVKNLFVVANDPTGGATADWAARLNPVVQALVAATPVIAGLVVLIPVAVGALAWLLHHVGDITATIAQTVAFAFRMVLLLRAAILAVIIDTVAVATNLISQVLPLIRDGLTGVLKAVFELIEAVVKALMGVLAAIGPGLKRFADDLMKFLRDGVGGLLTAIGDSVVMRFLVGFASMLPDLVAGLAAVSGTTLTPAQEAAIKSAQAKAAGLPSGFAPPATVKIDFPDLGKAFDTKTQDAVVKALEDGAKGVTDATNKAFNTAQDALVKSGDKINETLGAANAGLQDRLKTHVDEAKTASAGLGAALEAAAKPAAETGPFAEIARAYEAWFSRDGIKRMLDDFSAYLKAETQTAGGPGPVAGAALDLAKTTGTAEVVVDIDRVVIDLVPLGAAGAGPATTVVVPPPTAADPNRDARDRGAATIPGELLCR